MPLERCSNGGASARAGLKLVMLACLAVALGAGGCAQKDVLFVLDVGIGPAVARPSVLWIEARVTAAAGAGGETIEYATTISRPWPGDDDGVRLQLVLGPDARAIDAEISLLSASGFAIADTGIGQSFPGPGRYVFPLMFTVGEEPPPDGGTNDAGGTDAGSDAGSDAGGADAATDAGVSDAGDAGTSDGG